jgi:hypothetical protein
MRTWLCGVALLLAAPPAESPYRVCVKAAENAPQFSTAKEVADSVADVVKALKGMKEVTLVGEAKDAEVFVIVVDRGTGSGPAGYIGAQGPTSMGSFDAGKLTSAVELWLQATIKAADLSKEIVGTSPSNSWGGCAKDLAKQARSWLKANGPKLRAR